MKKLLFIELILLLLLAACAAPYEISQNNLADLYETGNRMPEPEYAIHHKSDSISEIFLKLHMPDFLYKKLQHDESPSARIKISYALYENYESKIVLDSATLYMTDSLNYKLDRPVIRNFEFMAKKPESVLKLSIKDMNRNQEMNMFLPVYKENEFTRQNFLIRTADNEVIYKQNFTKDESFKLFYPFRETGQYIVRYYDRDFPIALPPFSPDNGIAFDYKSDSTFIVPFNNHETSLICLPKQGFYHFQIDSGRRDGLTIFRFADDFPAVTAINEILEPLRYITTQKEFDHLSGQKNIKLAVDSFWLDNCANINRAREQIAKYYNRVQDANRLFTSYLEGWKTDRGMIYVVFGPPTHVFRGINTENWVYGEAGRNISLRFSFIRVNNPFSYNDFSLYRNPLYKEAFYNGVENWRH